MREYTLNPSEGNGSAFLPYAQVPKRRGGIVATVDRARGIRFGLARRLLGAVRGEDILAPDMARMLDYGSKAAYRWESGEDRPRDATVDEFAKICREAGLPITASWLERGETELPPIIIPESALSPKTVPAGKGASRPADERARGKLRATKPHQKKEAS